ncbi:MAG TPA: hypothetical protein EYP90_05180 [Chromatiaceae bacterium]|nr:hypothetical protein [Chromatiaceae bacterium]
MSKSPADENEANFIDVALVDDESRNSDYYLDSDRDGVYDWEEELWPELDPYNPDSDGDGVLDGKYIQTKRAIAERARLGDQVPESNLSETEKLGLNTFTALAAILESGGEIDELTEQKISDNIVEYVTNLTLGEKLYTRDQMKLVPNTKENSYSYRDRMTDLFKRYPVSTSDIELLIQAVKDPAEYQGRLRSSSKKYAEYLSELVSTEVPYLIAGRHTELTNNISQVSGVLDNLLEEEVDELVSLSFVVQLESILNQTVEAIIKINTFFDIIEDESLFNE